MKKNKKITIIFIIFIIVILLIPKKTMLWDGGTVKYKSLIYEITKYHRLDNNYKGGYNNGLKIKLFGITIYNSFKESITKETNSENLSAFYNDSLTKNYINIEKLNSDYGVEQAIKDNAVVVTNTIANSNLLNDFTTSINTKKRAFLRLVQTTVEGDLIITDIKYEIDKVIVITDNTRDKFSSEENRKITFETYKNIEEVLDLDKDPAISSLIVYNDNKEDNRVLLTRNRMIN